MDERVYRDMAALQDRHWWFRARREILGRVVKSLDLPPGASILEIGCGTGGNLKMLQSFGRVAAMETDAGARTHARGISGIPVARGRLPDRMPFGEKFDLVCLFDVLEHVENDRAALAAVRNRLKDGGRMILTVPAHMFLYGPHDRKLHHVRRYAKNSLAKLLNHSGFTVEKLTYFNTLLFPLAVFSRFLDGLFKPDDAIGYNLPGPFMNNLLFRVFRIEKRLLSHTNLPMGVSLLAVAGPHLKPD